MEDNEPRLPFNIRLSMGIIVLACIILVTQFFIISLNTPYFFIALMEMIILCMLTATIHVATRKKKIAYLYSYCMYLSVYICLILGTMIGILVYYPWLFHLPDCPPSTTTTTTTSAPTTIAGVTDPTTTHPPPSVTQRNEGGSQWCKTVEYTSWDGFYIAVDVILIIFCVICCGLQLYLCFKFIRVIKTSVARRDNYNVNYMTNVPGAPPRYHTEAPPGHTPALQMEDPGPLPPKEHPPSFEESQAQQTPPSPATETAPHSTDSTPILTAQTPLQSPPPTNDPVSLSPINLLSFNEIQDEAAI